MKMLTAQEVAVFLILTRYLLTVLHLGKNIMLFEILIWPKIIISAYF